MAWEISKGLLRNGFAGTRRLFRYCCRRNQKLTPLMIAEEIITEDLWNTPSGSRYHLLKVCKRSFGEGTSLTHNKLCGYCLSAKRGRLIQLVRDYGRQEVDFVESAV